MKTFTQRGRKQLPSVAALPVLSLSQFFLFLIFLFLLLLLSLPPSSHPLALDYGFVCGVLMLCIVTFFACDIIFFMITPSSGSKKTSP